MDLPSPKPVETTMTFPACIPTPAQMNAIVLSNFHDVAANMNLDDHWVVFCQFRRLHLERLLRLQTELGLGEVKHEMVEDGRVKERMAKFLQECSKCDLSCNPKINCAKDSISRMNGE
jgi:hypothetical protein